MRDCWMADDEPGCLQCGDPQFRASRVSGICDRCLAGAVSQSNAESGTHDIAPYVDHDQWEEYESDWSEV